MGGRIGQLREGPRGRTDSASKEIISCEIPYEHVALAVDHA